MTGYFVDDGALWRGDRDDHAPPVVAYRSELDLRDPALWPLLVAILTDEAATVERMARALAGCVMPSWWDQITESIRDDYRRKARAVLAALRTGTEA